MNHLVRKYKVRGLCTWWNQKCVPLLNKFLSEVGNVYVPRSAVTVTFYCVVTSKNPLSDSNLSIKLSIRKEIHKSDFTEIWNPGEISWVQIILPFSYARSRYGAKWNCVYTTISPFSISLSIIFMTTGNLSYSITRHSLISCTRSRDAQFRNPCLN